MKNDWVSTESVNKKKKRLIQEEIWFQEEKVEDLKEELTKIEAKTNETME